jgi:superfamily II DNA or RNA helicase
MNTGLYFYPSISSSNFQRIIANKKEFYDNRISNKLKNIYCLEPQQRLLSNFINPISPYTNLLVYHQVGLGKTLTAISIAEKFKNSNKIVVLVKNKLLEMNFKKELLGVCSNYITPEERKIINSTQVTEPIAQERKDLEIAVNKRINKHYSFMTYGYIVKKILDKKTKISLENVVLIIDEVHNLTGNDGYLAVKKLIEDAKNIRVILMSATPIYDNVEELFEISNLLNIRDSPLLPIRSQLAQQKLVVKRKLQRDSLLQDTVSNLTAAGRKLLLESLFGKVSYLLSDEKTFPEKIFNGSPISDIPGSLNIFRCVMSEFQDAVYSQSFSNPQNTLFKASSDAATIVYPDSSYGSKGYAGNIPKTGNKLIPFLQKDSLKKYSTKLYNLLKNLEKSPGTAFVYSNYVNQGGTDLIKHTLEQNGYSSYFVRNNKPKFLLITTVLTVPQRQRLLKVFNDPSNAYGDKIKIIIGSPLVSEGLTFKNIRQIHLLEPYWNLSGMDQIIGRGVRFQSHSALPARDRKVNIYLYTSISKISPSIDLLKYRLGENKDIIIKDIEYSIKRQAFDCELNKSQNTRRALDYSRECNYLRCHYNCERNGNTSITTTSRTSSGRSRSSSGRGSIRRSNDILDERTYMLEEHSPSEYQYIFEKIKNLFGGRGVKIFDVDYIVKYIKQSSGNGSGSGNFSPIDTRNVYLVLEAMLNKVDLIKENHTLLALGNYYILNDNDSPVNKSYFYQLFKRQLKTKTIEEILGIRERRHSVSSRSTSSPKRGSLPRAVVASKIYGSFFNKEGKNDNKFRIIDKRRSTSERQENDKRKVVSGKVCESYQKEDLEDIMKFFSIKVPAKISKTSMCLVIENFMKGNNLLVN